MTFGEGAARLSGAASMLLGWRPEEFWSATPAELMVAMSSFGGAPETPGAGVIEALRERFPDIEKA